MAMGVPLLHRVDTQCVCVCTGEVGLALVANPQNMVYTISSN